MTETLRTIISVNELPSIYNPDPEASGRKIFAAIKKQLHRLYAIAGSTGGNLNLYLLPHS